MIAKSAGRVAQNTDPHINDTIRRRMQMRLTYYREHQNEIPRRLDELDREWDVERMLATNSSAFTLAGMVLSQLKGRQWLLLSLAVQGFYLQHTLTGWCPPLPVMRKLGFRTPQEIENERHALLEIRSSVANESASESSNESANESANKPSGNAPKRRHAAAGK